MGRSSAYCRPDEWPLDLWYRNLTGFYPREKSFDVLRNYCVLLRWHKIPLYISQLVTNQNNHSPTSPRDTQRVALPRNGHLFENVLP